MPPPTPDSQRTDHLYHEAVRQAAQPRTLQRYSEPRSLLLTAPNNVIFELFGTVLREVPEARLLDFITNHLSEYLSQNWRNKIIERAVRRLRREQTLDQRAGLMDVPVISSSSKVGSVEQTRTSQRSVGKPSSPLPVQRIPLLRNPTLSQKSPPMAPSSPTQSRSPPPTPPPPRQQKSPPLNYREQVDSVQVGVRQVYTHIMWRIRSENVTQITSLIVKLALDDGFKRGKLKSEPYADVATCFQEWRQTLLIKLYAFGNAPANDQKLVLANSTAGDLTKWCANYIDGSEKRHQPDLIRKLAGALRDKTKNCMFITHELEDALASFETGAIRAALVVDRLNRYTTIAELQTAEQLIREGKLFVISSLACLLFAPDPTSESCC